MLLRILISLLMCRDVFFDLSRYLSLVFRNWCYWITKLRWWLLISRAVDLKNWLIMFGWDLWHVFADVPFLVAFVGVILMIFLYAIEISVNSKYYSCGVISFPGVYTFLLSSRGCYPGESIWTSLWSDYCCSWMSMKFQFHLFIGFVGCCLVDNRCFCCERPLRKTRWWLVIIVGVSSVNE